MGKWNFGDEFVVRADCGAVTLQDISKNGYLLRLMVIGDDKHWESVAVYLRKHEAVMLRNALDRYLMHGRG